MTALEHYQPPAPVQLVTAPVPASSTAMERAADFSTWAAKLQSAAAIAAEIANTEFVPAALRGKIPAVTAAILAGSEMQLGPMASLMHVHIIEGRPALSAEMARSLVYSQGHQIRWVESTTQRCVIEGLRRGDRDWFRVQYTLDDAKRAGLDGRPNWRRHPRRMLAARASGELCRLHFADALAGMPYVAEELEDDSDDAELPAAGDSPATAAPRTVQRRRATPKQAPTKATGARPTAAGAAAGTPAAGGPTPHRAPLPGEPGYDEPGETPTTSVGAGETEDSGDAKATAAQNRMMHALFREAGVRDRDERLELTGLLLDRPLDTSAGITVRDAGTVIDTLERLKTAGHPDGLSGAVTDLMNNAALKRAEDEIAAEQGEQGAAEDDARGET